jgi:hypothetical protein
MKIQRVQSHTSVHGHRTIVPATATLLLVALEAQIFAMYRQTDDFDTNHHTGPASGGHCDVSVAASYSSFVGPQLPIFQNTQK